MINEKFNQLKDKLRLIIAEVGHRKELKQGIGKEFMSRNIPAHRAMHVFMGNESLDTMYNVENDIRFLFIFSVALNKALEEERIDVKEYFTILEYNKYVNYREEERDESIFPITFKNVVQITDNIWQATMTAKELYEMDANNVFVYNFLTQRQPKITSAGVQIDFDKRKTIEIKERMLDGEQFPDHIKINILRTFQEQIHFNARSQTLTVGENSIINTFDGHHRKVANSLAVNENPDIEFNWGLIITNMSESEARDYMIQIDKQKPIKREQIRTWDTSRKENLVVSVIADDKISRLNKIMVEQRSEIKNKRGLVTKSIIAEAIDENYEIDETTDIRALGKWIVEFTDELMSLYPMNTQNDSMINDENLFYGYIALSAKLKDEPDWTIKLRDRMETINFNKDNPAWRQLGLLGKRKLTKLRRKKIYNLFKESK